jgi:hypothetical protein
MVAEIDERSMILPAAACARLNHPTSWQQVSAAGDRIEVCSLCSLGHRDAVRAGLTVEEADGYVRMLRADTEPYAGADEEGGDDE